jgi:S-disulfanyl-L-cysteine oxidoreductase SoxD
VKARRTSLIVAIVLFVVSGFSRTAVVGSGFSRTAVVVSGFSRTIDDQTTRTVWDGVYTAGQAERGRASYLQSCVSCHRDDLRGDNTAPSLVGESFLFLWGDMSVGELSARIQKIMPPDRPGSLTPQTYIDIIAFILQKNAFPAGSAELGINPEALQQIRITTARP